MTDDTRRTTRSPRPASVIAIDGPAASGKSSTAAAVARALGYVHIDSGSLYRALTWVGVHRGVHDPVAILAQAAMLHVGLERRDGVLAVHIDGVADIEAAIRSPEVNVRVSGIAAVPMLRDWVNVKLRAAIADLDGVVIDGRDIGTVVMPDADIKVFLTATAKARAERRLRQRGDVVDPLQLAAETSKLEQRDHLDGTRAAAPLRQAPDAVVLDTTALTFEQQVERIVAIARARGAGGGRGSG